MIEIGFILLVIAALVMQAQLGKLLNNARDIRKLAEQCEQHLRAMRGQENEILRQAQDDKPPPIPPKAVAPEFEREQHGDTVTYR